MLEDIVKTGKDFSDRYERMRRSKNYDSHDGISHDEYKIWMSQAKLLLKAKNSSSIEIMKKWDEMSNLDNYGKGYDMFADDYSHIQPYAERHAALFSFLVDNVDFNDTRGEASKSPWGTGSFYLVTAVVVTLLLAFFFYVYSNLSLPFWSVPIMVIGLVLVVVTVGAFQLRFDEKLCEASFFELIKEVLMKLALIKKQKDSSTE